MIRFMQASLAVGGVALLAAGLSGMIRYPVPEPAVPQEAAPRFTVLETKACGVPIMTERHPNDDFKSFHVTAMLTTDAYEDLLVADDSPNIELVRDLCEVNGVGKVMLRPREIIIEKSPGFTWDEVQPKVVEAIGFHLGPCPPAEK